MKIPRNQSGGRLGLLALAASALLTAPALAQTVWDGGAAPDYSINNPTNWDNDIVNSLNESQTATFSTLGTNATLNVNAKFKTVVFNQPAGFTINGPGTLTVSNSTTSASANVTVSIAQNAGPTVIAAPFAVETATAGTKLLNVLNNSAPGGPGLIFSNSIFASNPATNYAFRLQGSGWTKFYGPISNCSGIQPAFAANSGTNIFAGNQSLGANTAVNIPGTGTATSGSSVRIQMGDSPADIQSWGSTLLSQLGTVAINSTATLSGGISNATASSGGLSGGIVEVNGNLTAPALSLGGSAYFGTVKLGGRAYFSGTVTIGATAGNTIIGIAPTNATLVLSSGSISSSVTIGGVNPNENNIELVKTNAGTLNLGGTHTYTGATLVKGGILNLSGAISSPVTVSSGASIGGEGSTTAAITFAPGTANFNFDPTTVGALTGSNIIATGATLVISPSTAGTGIVFQATTPGGIAGTVGANFILGSRGGNLALDPTGSALWFTNGVAAPANLKWVGNAANPTFWDVVTTTNWSNGGSVDRYYAGDSVLFDDTASSYLVAQQVATVGPGSTVVSNNANAYVLTNAAIIGSGSVTKYGAASLTVYGGGHGFTGGLTINGGTVSLIGAANTFTGGITNNGGLLVIGNINQIGANTGSTASSNLVVLNGGGLGYTGGTITSDTLTFLLAGGTSTINIDSGTTNNFILRTGAAVTGPGNLIKSGTGTLALGRNTTQDPLNSTFTGKITVTAGELDIRQADSLGDVAGITEINNATLYVDPFGQPSGMTFNPEPLVFSGESFLRNFNQGTTSSQVNVLQGVITNNGILNIYSQTNGAYGELQINGAIKNAAATTLRFGRAISNNAVATANMNQFITVNGAVNGPASVSAEGSAGSIYTLAGNNYSGNTTVTGGKLALGQATLATNSTVSVSNAVLELNFGGATNVIGSLFLNGVAQSAGVYNVTSHPALLAGDGSLQVVPVSSIASNPTNITFTAGGGSLNLSWPASHLGWILQTQTNSRSVGLTPATNAWFDISGSASATNATITINPADPTVFFRLRKP